MKPISYGPLFEDIYSRALAAFGKLKGAANKLPYFTSASTMALTDLVAQARSFLANPSAQFVDFIQTGTGAITRSTLNKDRDLVDARDFGATQDGTTQQALVQAMLNSVPVRGINPIHVPPGIRFDPSILSFPRRMHMLYALENESTTPGWLSGGSGELVWWLANSSYKVAPPDGFGNDPSGAIVNEIRFTGTLHPSVSIDVRKTNAGHDAYISPAQSRLNPARASYNIQDDRNDVWRVVYENYQNYSNFSGVSQHTWKRTARLNGIGTAQWASVAPKYTMITGTTSGAKGFLLSVTAGYTELEIYSGLFVVGETLSDNNETTSAVITSLSHTITPNSPLAVSTENGAHTFGDMPPRAAKELVNVSGNIRLTPTRGVSFNNPRQVTKPSILLGTSQEIASPQLVGIQYDPARKTDSTRRLTIVRGESEVVSGELVPTSVLVSFSNTFVVGDDSVNVASIASGGTGIYNITYISALARIYGAWSIGIDAFYMPGWSAGMTFPTTAGCQIRVFNDAGALTDLPANAVISFMMYGADL